MQNKVAYFDNAATTFPKPEEVYSFMDKFYRSCGVNIGRGQHMLSARATTLSDETRELILDLFHCHNKQVVFTHTATDAINLVLNGLDIQKNTTVYISPFEHNAVTRTLNYLQKTNPFEIEQLSVSKNDLSYDLDGIKAQFSKKAPSLVIVSHASNVCGIVAPVEEIFTEAKRFSAVTLVDMCQTAGLIDINLSSDIFDYAVFEGHKTLYGPMGIGGLIVKRTLNLPPLIYGGTGFESANQDMPNSIPEKYEAGSHNISAIAGLNAAVKWILKTEVSTIASNEKILCDRLISCLQEFDNIKVILPKKHIGVISCLFENYSSDNIGLVLSQNDVAVRTGLHCAPYAHKFLGTYPNGTVRFSVSYFCTDDDFSILRSALQYIYDNS